MLCPFMKETINQSIQTRDGKGDIVINNKSNENFKECLKEKCITFVKSVDKYNKDYCKLCK